MVFIIKEKLSPLKRIVSEYFLGTETREFYDNQIAKLSEHLQKDSRSLQQRKNCCSLITNTYQIFGKYIPNLVGIYSIASLVGYFITNDEDLLYQGLTSLIASESLRNVIRLHEKENKKIASAVTDLLITSNAVSNKFKKLFSKEEDKGWLEPYMG